MAEIVRSNQGSETLKRAVALSFLAFTASIAMRAEWWMMVAMLAVAILSLLILLDALFFAGNVYSSPSEPTAISGLMQSLPWLAFPFVATDLSSAYPVGLAFLSGVLSMGGFYLYFRVMSDDQDAVVVSILFNLMIAVVPILAYFTIGERLSSLQYVGISFLFVGAVVASFQKAKSRWLVVVLMVGAVLLMSASAVVMKDVFETLEREGNDSIFWSGFLPRAAGAAFVGALFFARISARRESRSPFFALILKFWPVFLLIEAAQVLTDGLSSLAVSVGDVSVITAIDGLMGVFAAGLSVFLAVVLSRTKLREASQRLRLEQFENFGLKVTGMTLIVIGAYLVA